MLHIAAGVALGIFGGFMLIQAWAAWQTRREVRRAMAMLYPAPAPKRPEGPSILLTLAATGTLGFTLFVVITAIVTHL
jgi:hypothetical protein